VSSHETSLITESTRSHHQHMASLTISKGQRSTF
jgi:hypothetical protein